MSEREKATLDRIADVVHNHTWLRAGTTHALSPATAMERVRQILVEDGWLTPDGKAVRRG